MAHHRHLGASELIDKQFFLWKQSSLGRGDASELPAGGPTRETFGPYVTLSRQYGGGALTVAGRLSERLGWPVYDRELLDEIASEANVRTTVIESLDERTQHWLGEYLSALGFCDTFDEGDYCRHLVKVVTTLARHGRAIFVGRGANFFLPPESGLRVRLEAPQRFRAQELMRTKGLPEADAVELLAREDAARALFVKRHFGRDVDEPSAYDLVLDVSKRTPAELVDEIERAMRRKRLNLELAEATA